MEKDSFAQFQGEAKEASGGSTGGGREGFRRVPGKGTRFGVLFGTLDE